MTTNDGQINLPVLDLHLETRNFLLLTYGFDFYALTFEFTFVKMK